MGQAQWTKALNQDRDLLFITRLTTQLSPDSLLPLEQFTLGGVGTVRGYRQNQEVGDNAVVGTIEIYVPLEQFTLGGVGTVRGYRRRQNQEVGDNASSGQSRFTFL